MEGETLGMVYLLQVDCSLSLIVGAGADSLPLDFHSSGPTEESKTLLQLTEASVFSSPEKVANSDVDLCINLNQFLNLQCSLRNIYIF